MATSQPAILADTPSSARFLVLSLDVDCEPKRVVDRLTSHRPAPSTVIGLGLPLTKGLGATIKGLREFPAVAGPGVAFPSTQGAIWVAMGGEDAGETLHRARAFVEAFGGLVAVQEEVLCFKYAGGRDLGGYEDGTESPKGEKAVAAAIVAGSSPAMDGSSFVAAQRWVHDLKRFSAFDRPTRDAIIGRRQDTNEELSDAPPSAHVKRTAQESYDPPAFMVRRSMPWGTSTENGLYFVAYGASLDAFERVLKRMAGLEDGVIDGLSRFTHAVSGGYYWCPPLRDGRLDLGALGK